MASRPLTLGLEMQQTALGIDLGGTQVRAALVDERGNLVARREERTEAKAGPGRILAQIRKLADELVTTSKRHEIVGIGVSAPGPIDTVAGIATAIPTLSGFADYPLLAELRKLFEYPVSLENDGIAAAIGEWQFGAGRGIDHLLYATVSTGLGGGVIADGRILRGRRGMAAHIGHMSVNPDGELCPCGNKGCFEAYGSGTAFTRRARFEAARSERTIAGKTGEDIHSRDVFAAGRTGDELANRLIDEEAEILGRGFTSLIHIYSPEILVIGGGLSNEFDRLKPGIQDYIRRFAMPGFKDVKVVRAALEQNSGLIGAAALAFLGAGARQEKATAMPGL